MDTSLTLERRSSDSYTESVFLQDTVSLSMLKEKDHTREEQTRKGMLREFKTANYTWWASRTPEERSFA